METRWVDGRAIIVHPQFKHTLPGQRAAAQPARWQNLPVDILHRVASQLPAARDLCNFERICKSSRCAGGSRNYCPGGSLPKLAPPIRAGTPNTSEACSVWMGCRLERICRTRRCNIVAPAWDANLHVALRITACHYKL